MQEPDINVDFTANRSKNPMRALMFWKNTAQTGYAWFAVRLCAGYVTCTCPLVRLGEKVMKVKVRLKGLLDRLLDAVNANDVRYVCPGRQGDAWHTLMRALLLWSRASLNIVDPLWT